MYKEEMYFNFLELGKFKISYVRSFQTESEYNSFMSDRLAEGLVYVGEEAIEIPVYPQVLRLDLKSPGNSYYKVIERFESKEDYLRYCDYKLLEGFKVIGSEPYFKEIENA